MRNDKVFEDKEVNLIKLFQDIKSQGFTWIRNRANFRNLVWKDLCNVFLVLFTVSLRQFELLAHLVSFNEI